MKVGVWKKFEAKSGEHENDPLGVTLRLKYSAPTGGVSLTVKLGSEHVSICSECPWHINEVVRAIHALSASLAEDAKGHEEGIMPC